jgi:hypothetical protein
MGLKMRFSLYRVSSWWVFKFVVGVLAVDGGARAGGESLALLDPAQAGPDFFVQGEYVGTVGGKRKVAAQVVARGDGVFGGVLYLGGLPGAGWDGVTRFHFGGKRNGDVARFVGVMGERLEFENPNFSATLQEGLLRGTAQMFHNIVEETSFEMSRVERCSPTQGAVPPSGAIVLFDGTSVDQWNHGRIVEQGFLDVGAISKRQFKSLKLHIEFRTPFMPTSRGMGRGNSGLYIKNEWEVQIVDSFGWNSENRKFERLANFGRCGGIHELVKPRVNMCFPPLSWQTYDVTFIAAQFDGHGERVLPAMMTVVHNGVLIHDKFVLPPTPRGTGESKEAEFGPIYLQNHSNPVRFRNIWVIEVDEDSEVSVGRH